MIDKIMRRKRWSSAHEAFGYVTQFGKAQRVVFSPILRDDVDLAADLMEAVAKANKRVKKPLYHFALAWARADTPTKQQMEEVALGALQRLGMLEHQWVAAVHDDAGHPHIHVLVNVVHPDTYRCASTSYDFFKLGQYATEVERRYGWMELRRFTAPGPQIKIGNLLLYERDLLPRSRGNGRPLAPTEAAFQTWLREKILLPFVTAVGCTNARWRDALVAIGRYGVRYVASGSGARFVDAFDPSISIAASSIARFVSLPSLEKYLGAFEDVAIQIDAARAFSRSTAVLGLSATEPYRKLASRYRFEKDAHRDRARSMRRAALDAQRAKEVAQRAQIREECRNRLRGIAGNPKSVRIEARSHIVAARDEALERLRRQHAWERDRLRVEFGQAAIPEPWSEFIDRLVRDGNVAALTYVRRAKRFPKVDKSLPLFSVATGEPARSVAGGPTANELTKMLPSVTTHETVPTPMTQQITGPSLLNEAHVTSTQEESAAVRQRLRRIGKVRTPKMDL